MKKNTTSIKKTIEKQGLAAGSSYRQLNLGDIKNVTQGACFLASGGGGSLQLALTKIIPAFFNEQTVINLVGLEALAWEGDWGGVVAGMGSPLKLFKDPELVKAAIPAYEKLAELCFAFKAAGILKYESLKLMDFCLPVEIGAVNSIVPMIVANGLLPPIVVVDADGTGRAVPILQLTTYARQIELYPNILGGNNETESGTYFDYGSVSVQDETTLEAAFLGMIESEAFGYASGLAIYAANGPAFQRCNPVPNGVSDSLQTGIIISQTTGIDRLYKVLGYINKTMGRTAKQVFYGKVTEMKQATEGLDTGYVIITGAGAFDGQSFKLFIENENIWGQITNSAGTKPWIVGPDSMNYLTDDGDVFDNSDLWTLYQKGERPNTSVIGIQAASMVRENSGLMIAWVQEVQSKKGPDSYITPWITA